MALWDLTKVDPVHYENTSKAPVESETCYWCGQWIGDRSDEQSNNPLWASGGTYYGCNYNPNGCQSGNHFHGYDEEEYGEQKPHDAYEAAEWPYQGEWNDDDYEDACIIGSHEPIGAVVRKFKEGLLSLHPNTYEQRNRPVRSDSFDSKKEEEIKSSCAEGTCGKRDCHSCHPDWLCSIHKTCINSRKCSECGASKANARIDWGTHDKDECEQNTGEEHSAYHEVFHDAIQNEYASDLGFEPTYNGDVTAEMVAQDEVYERHGSSGDWKVSMLDNPVCPNPECPDYEL